MTDPTNQPLPPTSPLASALDAPLGGPAQAPPRRKLSDDELQEIVSAALSRLGRGRSADRIHKKSGAAYVIEGVALTEATLDPVVVYRKAFTGVQFTRPLAEFLEKFD